MSNLDGPKKNRAVVRSEFNALRAELATLPPRLKQAAKEKDILEFLHTATNYIGEPIDQMPRFWLYTWAPKWALVAFLIWYF